MLRAARPIICLLIAVTAAVATARAADLLVTSANTDQILRFDGETGELVGVFIDGWDAGDMTFGPDGNLYTTRVASTVHAVFRFDGETGDFIDDFVPDGSGGLRNAGSLTFGPDGHLYVANENGLNDRILRYDGVTGDFIDVFAALGDQPGIPVDFTFGPDGDVFVSFTDDQIARYDGITGDFIDVFVDHVDGVNPHDLKFGPDGNLYVASNLLVARYDGVTGDLLEEFGVGTTGSSLIFGEDGLLYVGSSLDSIDRYQGETSEFIDTFVAEGTGGLDLPRNMAFFPSPSISGCIATEGEPVAGRRVILRLLDDSTVLDTLSDDDGCYVFDGLDAGRPFIVFIRGTTR